MLLNIIVLILEVLYYSLFVKFVRKEGKLWKYILLFSLINVFFYFVGTNKVYSYLLLILMIIYGCKYIVKIKVSMYDFLVMIIMLLYKLIIEFILTLSIYAIFKDVYNIYVGAIIVSIFKILSLFIIKPKMNLLYNKLKKLWDNNNFYIRYITSILIMIYVIAICALLIVKLI